MKVYLVPNEYWPRILNMSTPNTTGLHFRISTKFSLYLYSCLKGVRDRVSLDPSRLNSSSLTLLFPLFLHAIFLDCISTNICFAWRNSYDFYGIEQLFFYLNSIFNKIILSLGLNKVIYEVQIRNFSRLCLGTIDINTKCILDISRELADVLTFTVS